MAREVKQWITVNGKHVPIFEGESTEEAVKRAVKKTQGTKKTGGKKEPVRKQLKNVPEHITGKNASELHKKLEEQGLGMESADASSLHRRDFNDEKVSLYDAYGNEYRGTFNKYSDGGMEVVGIHKEWHNRKPTDTHSTGVKEIKEKDDKIKGNFPVSKNKGDKHDQELIKAMKSIEKTGQAETSNSEIASQYKLNKNYKVIKQADGTYKISKKQSNQNDTQKQISKDNDEKEKQIARNKKEADERNGKTSGDYPGDNKGLSEKSTAYIKAELDRVKAGGTKSKGLQKRAEQLQAELDRRNGKSEKKKGFHNAGQGYMVDEKGNYYKRFGKPGEYEWEVGEFDLKTNTATPGGVNFKTKEEAMSFLGHPKKKTAKEQAIELNEKRRRQRLQQKYNSKLGDTEKEVRATLRKLNKDETIALANRFFASWYVKDASASALKDHMYEDWIYYNTGEYASILGLKRL